MINTNDWTTIYARLCLKKLKMTDKPDELKDQERDIFDATGLSQAYEIDNKYG